MSGQKKKEFFNFFSNNPKKQQEEKKNFIFDETSFELVLKGGTIHSEQIIVEANSEFIDEKISLLCTWFLISPSNDIVKLDQFTHEFFQPSVDEIGYKLMVQAVPVWDVREYEGMPKSAEVGPLEMDPEIQEEINELLENEKMTVLLTLTAVVQGNLEIPLPCSCLLKITLKQIELQFKKEDQVVKTLIKDLDPSYPQCRSISGTQNRFSLVYDQDLAFEMESKDNVQRDIILTVVKSFYGKSLCVDDVKKHKKIKILQSLNQSSQVSSKRDSQNKIVEEEEKKEEDEQKGEEKQQEEEPKFNDTLNQWREREKSLTVKLKSEDEQPTKKKKDKEKPNADYFMQVNENARLKQENSQLLVQLQQLKESQKSNQSKEQLTNCTKNFYNIEQAYGSLKKSFESANDQKNFLQQDVNMYKAQSLEFQEIITNLKQQIDQLQKKNRRATVVSDLNQVKSTNESLQSQLNEKDLQIEQLMYQIQEQRKDKESQENVSEQLLNELYHEKRKYESLAMEKGIIQQSPGITHSQWLNNNEGSKSYSVEKLQSLQNCNSFRLFNI